MPVPAWFARLPWWTPRRRLEWYPPFRAMGVRVLHLSDDWRSARILLPLRRFNRNPGGGMFGGAIASLADPIPALACNRVFPGHQLWTRSLSVDFVREARTDLELCFDFPADVEADTRTRLADAGRADPVFEYDLNDAAGQRCAHIRNCVAIRPVDFIPPARQGARKREP